MLAVTHSELLLRDHFTALYISIAALPTLIFAKYNFPSIMFWTFLNLKGKKKLYYTRSISYFVALVCFIARARN
jgi:hypothetical protein